MKSKENVEEKITLESLNEEINSLKKEIKKLPDKKETEGYFNANLLYSFALVLVAVTIPLIVQASSYTKDMLWLLILSYFIISIGFLYLSKKFLPKGK